MPNNNPDLRQANLLYGPLPLNAYNQVKVKPDFHSNNFLFSPILNACLIKFYTLCQLKAVPSIQTDLAVGASLWFNICELNY